MREVAEETNPGLGAGIYQAFWRWHFYAGLMVMPVLMLMALTGGIYLFKDEIENLIYRPLLTTPPGAVRTTPRAWADAALTAVPGRLAELTPPPGPGRSARFVVVTSTGAHRAVYVDPRDAHVIGSMTDGGAMRTVKRLHSLDIAGPIANALVEIVAGWAIVLVATGAVLWWPRGQGGGVVTIRGGPRRRVFWRDLHAVAGIFAGSIVAFLAVTGMPWSAVWGQEVRKLTTEAGWGRPAPPVGTQAHAHHGAPPVVPWTLQDTDMRGMDMPGMRPALDLDGAVSQAAAAGLAAPYTLTIPERAGQAWAAASMPGPADQERTIYLDAHDGHILADIGYAHYGPAAKAIEWGIAVHQGQAYGLANKLVMLAGCIAVWLLGVSAPVMWWKRRPRGSLAAPPRPTDRRAYGGLAAVVIPLALIYPLVGASIIAALGVDFAFRRIGLSMRRPLENSI